MYISLSIAQRLLLQEVCMMLEEVVASRVKHYLEASKQRGQWKSMERASSGPLFLTGKVHYFTYCEVKYGGNCCFYFLPEKFTIRKNSKPEIAGFGVWNYFSYVNEKIKWVLIFSVIER